MRVLSQILNFPKALFSLAAPVLCLSCRRQEPEENKKLCFSCNTLISVIHEKADVSAALIGKELLVVSQDREVFALMYYTKKALSQDLLHQIKYYNKPSLAVYLGSKLQEKYFKEIEVSDILIPVPLHPKRQYERGFNQAQKIAEGISKQSGCIIRNDILKRVIYQTSQTKRSKAERENDLGHTYIINPKALIPNGSERVILVDDVITTGSTIAACISQLNTVGIVKINIATIAISI
jgi:competence protein ComFC